MATLRRLLLLLHWLSLSATAKAVETAEDVDLWDAVEDAPEGLVMAPALAPWRLAQGLLVQVHQVQTEIPPPSPRRLLLPLLQPPKPRIPRNLTGPPPLVLPGCQTTALVVVAVTSSTLLPCLPAAAAVAAVVGVAAAVGVVVAAAVAAVVRAAVGSQPGRGRRSRRWPIWLA